MYVDAPDDAVVGWFCGRLAELFRAAADDPTSFYAQFASWPDGAGASVRPGRVGRHQRVNLEQHIRPTRAHADVVIEKAADHSIAKSRSRGNSWRKTTAIASRMRLGLEAGGAEGGAADLAGVVAERFVDELDGAGQLVAHEALGQELEELLVG